MAGSEDRARGEIDGYCTPHPPSPPTSYNPEREFDRICDKCFHIAALCGCDSVSPTVEPYSTVNVETGYYTTLQHPSSTREEGGGGTGATSSTPTTLQQLNPSRVHSESWKPWITQTCAPISNPPPGAPSTKSHISNQISSSRHQEYTSIAYRDPQGVEDVRRRCYREEYKILTSHAYTVCVGQSRILKTNISISPSGRLWGRKLEIVKNDDGHGGWLAESLANVLLVKEGVVSPVYSGNLGVKVLNKSDRDVVIPVGTPLGKMCASPYEY